MEHRKKANRHLTPGEYVLCYALYAMLVGLGFVVVFVIWPTTIVAVTIALTESLWVHRGVYPFSMLLLGLGWFILTLLAGGYLRSGITRGRLWPRFLSLALPLVVAGGLGLLLRWWSV